MIALIGIILLIGIVKKNGIMLVDFALQAERQQGLVPRAGDLPGLPAALPADPDDDAWRLCWAPLPLMLGSGAGSEIRQPLGYTMFGGLLVSQALTLFTTPVIYLYLDDLSHWLTSFRRHEPEHSEPEHVEVEIGPPGRKLAAE